MEEPGLFFKDINGNRLGSGDLWPIPLFKGMKITIHGHGMNGEHRVVDWSYHHGHPNEDWGLTVILEET